MSKKASVNTPAKQPEPVQGKVLVKHYRLHPNSPDIDTTSVKYQYYEPDYFEEAERENEEEGKENTFQRIFGSNSKYEVIDKGETKKQAKS